jgi:hypothetical protein
LRVVQFNDSMMKSRYLKIPRSPKLMTSDKVNQHFFVEELSDENIFLLTFQSKRVEIRRRITCHPEANQKKTYELSSNNEICMFLFLYANKNTANNVIGKKCE